MLSASIFFEGDKKQRALVSSPSAGCLFLMGVVALLNFHPLNGA